MACRYLCAALLVWIATSLMGCQTQPLPAAQPGAGQANTPAPVDLASTLKTIEELPGWESSQPAGFYNRDNLYDLMNGQSDAFFVYGFEQTGVQRFQHSEHEEAILMVSVFQVNTPESAYGLFSVNLDGESISVGNEGAGTPGRRLAFWQSRYFVQMTALKPLPQERLLEVASALSEVLPKGGQRPDLANQMPDGGQKARFFHEELSIQDMVYLGGENLLGLGPDTGGMIAQYTLDGQDGWLLLIEYPDTERAATCLEVLQSGKVDEVVVSQAQGKQVAAVFGSLEATKAQQLLDKTFSN